MQGLPNVLLMGIGAIILIGSCAFSMLSLRENSPRAAVLSALFGTFTSLPFLLIHFLPTQISQVLPLGTLSILVLGTILYYAPIGRVQDLEDERVHPFDERDIVFSRLKLKPGSAEYRSYYAIRPENLEQDEKIRSLPGWLAADAQKTDPLLFPSAKASFEVTEALRESVDGPVAAEPIHFSAREISSYLKGLTLHLGADQVGITELNPTHVYSHIGRGTGNYGDPISLPHSYAIAFSVEMDYDMMGRVPDAPVVLESARKYVDGAVIAIQLANLCRRLGYPARAHIDGNYRVIAPLVARSAGLGEIGRMGILMTPNLGPRVRLGIVTTDLPLVPDTRADGRAMIDFCSICMKCVENCPSSAIPSGDREEIEGGYRWKLQEERCFHYWNVIGTDCGICMSVCPYSHPDNWAHNLIRTLVDRSGFARRVMVRLDDLFYGRKPPHRTAPRWVTHHSPPH